MRRTVGIAAIAAAALALLAGLAFIGAVWLGDRKLARSVEVRVVPVPYVKDAASIQLGKYLFESRGCAECHGADGRGIAVVDGSDGMYVKSPNITRGPGGVVADYNEGDWVRAIRHGVNPKAHALFLMPSEEYNRLSDNDFAALVAYVRTLPPVPGDAAVMRLPTVVRALYGVGVIRDAAEKIDHRKPPTRAVAAAVSAEHGAYVAYMCIGCHGPDLSGGKIAGAPPDWPPAANLTAGAAMARYDDADKFVAMMRTGKRPDGSSVNPVMPFASLRNLNDVDLKALYLYLKTLDTGKAAAT